VVTEILVAMALQELELVVAAVQAQQVLH